MDHEVLNATRRTLHGVAELVLAGPQYRRSGEIQLRVRPAGFATVAEPYLRVEGANLAAGEARYPMIGTTYTMLAAGAGIDVGAPAGLYSGGSGAHPDDPVTVDPAAAGHLADCLERGDAALRRLAPAETPILWPEHFDVGITVDRVNYGVSLGDDWLDEPYAYIGPGERHHGTFWNAPFGAAQPMNQLRDVEALTAYLAEGRERAAG